MPELARCGKHKLDKFSAGVRDDIESKQIVSKPGDFSILLVLNDPHIHLLFTVLREERGGNIY